MLPHFAHTHTNLPARLHTHLKPILLFRTMKSVPQPSSTPTSSPWSETDILLHDASAPFEMVGVYQPIMGNKLMTSWKHRITGKYYLSSDQPLVYQALLPSSPFLILHQIRTENRQSKYRHTLSSDATEISAWEVASTHILYGGERWSHPVNETTVSCIE